jgi:hypothetical protein
VPDEQAAEMVPPPGEVSPIEGDATATVEDYEPVDPDPEALAGRDVAVPDEWVDEEQWSDPTAPGQEDGGDPESLT